MINGIAQTQKPIVLHKIMFVFQMFLKLLDLLDLFKEYANETS